MYWIFTWKLLDLYHISLFPENQEIFSLKYLIWINFWKISLIFHVSTSLQTFLLKKSQQFKQIYHNIIERKLWILGILETYRNNTLNYNSNYQDSFLFIIIIKHKIMYILFFDAYIDLKWEISHNKSICEFYHLSFHSF